jgi:glutamate carboxypeptidase
MKAGLMMALFAMRSIQALNLKPAKNIALVLNSEEEISSPTSRPIIEAEAERSRYALILEPAREGNLITWRKGIGRFEMTITGKAVHAGVEPEKGISAIEELARQILDLHAMNAPKSGISVNVGVVNGGTRSNVVAAKAKAFIDLRVKTQADGERMVKAILNLQPKLSGARLEISGKLRRPPFEETPAGLLLFKKAQRIAAELGFEIDKTGTGGGSDGNFSAALGIPTLDGLGNVGSGSHALSEHTVIDTFPQRAALLAELILAL